MPSNKLKIIIILMAVFAVAITIAPHKASAENKDLNSDINNLKSEKQEEKISAIQALGDREIKATQRGAMALRPMLKDDDKQVKIEAIKALGKIERNAKIANGDLIKMLDDKDPEVSAAAAESLEKIGTMKGKKAAEEYRNKNKPQPIQ